MYEHELSKAIANNNVQAAYTYITSGRIMEVQYVDFLRAIKMGNWPLVKEFCKFPSIILTFKNNYSYPIKYAIWNGQTEIALALIEIPFVQQKISPEGKLSLLDAIMHNKPDVVDYWLSDLPGYFPSNIHKRTTPEGDTTLPSNKKKKLNPNTPKRSFSEMNGGNTILPLNKRQKSGFTGF